MCVDSARRPGEPAPASGGPTPLDARRFFAGVWEGAGELLPRGPARLLMRREAVRLHGRGEWLSDRLWRVHERFEMASGWSFERSMFMEHTGPTRLHVTADDIPLGAEVELHPAGFRFLRFRTWLPYAGLRMRMGCASDSSVGADGVLHGRVCLDFWRIPVATLTLAIRIEPGA